MNDALDELLHSVRVGQFVSVGAAGATVETIIVAALTVGYAVDPVLAKAAGAETSISLMFLLNDRWTFSAAGAAGVLAGARRWLRSHFVRAVGLAVAFVTLTVLTEFTAITLVVAGGDFWPTVANLVGIGFGMVVNYVFESLFTWRVASG